MYSRQVLDLQKHTCISLTVYAWLFINNTGFTHRITVMSDGEILNHFPVSTFVGLREWGVTSLVDCTCKCTTDGTIDGPYAVPTFRITMILFHKVLGCFQVTIGTG